MSPAPGVLLVWRNNDDIITPCNITGSKPRAIHMKYLTLRSADALIGSAPSLNGWQTAWIRSRKFYFGVEGRSSSTDSVSETCHAIYNYVLMMTSQSITQWVILTREREKWYQDVRFQFLRSHSTCSLKASRLRLWNMTVQNTNIHIWEAK